MSRLAASSLLDRPLILNRHRFISMPASAAAPILPAINVNTREIGRADDREPDLDRALMLKGSLEVGHRASILSANLNFRT
jgi:hypothetical protein